MTRSFCMPIFAGVSALCLLGSGIVNSARAGDFGFDEGRIVGAKPWTSEEFNNDPDDFQFMIVGDRTGGANIEGTFALAMKQINLLQPEFVINVGDQIEGYTENKVALNAEWDEVDKMLDGLDMPFFRTPGNHDIANVAAQEVWRERYGPSYYSFTYNDTLFLVIDSEDPPRVAPEGIAEKLVLYARLQKEDPEAAKALGVELASDESVVAGLAEPINLHDEQIAFLKSALEENADVRWTVLFMHEPAWENPSQSFEEVQELLKDRKHSFFAGHLHYYDYDLIEGVEYITMGPAGASFHKDGPGNVDHVTWVTMTDEGPQIANIALKGLFDRKGLDPSLFGAYDRKGED